jgi:hypothetical protein
MLREISTDEMEMVSGGSAPEDDIIIVEGRRRNKAEFTPQNPFGGRSSSEQYHEDFQPGGGGFPGIGGVEDVAVTQQPYDKCANSQRGVATTNDIVSVGKFLLETRNIAGVIAGGWLTTFGSVGLAAASFGVHVNCDD